MKYYLDPFIEIDLKWLMFFGKLRNRHYTALETN